MAALQYVVVDQPETASQESSFTCRQAVRGVFGLVAPHEFTIDQKSFLDCAKSSVDPWVLRWKKTQYRNQKQTGVELLGTVGLNKAVEVPVEAPLTDLGVDFVRDVAPRCPDSLKA
jgi:hypothetical protein